MASILLSVDVLVGILTGDEGGLVHSVVPCSCCGLFAVNAFCAGKARGGDFSFWCGPLVQEEPIFNLPSRMLELLVEVDKLVTQWRVRHAIMVHRCVCVWCCPAPFLACARVGEGTTFVSCFPPSTAACWA